jgi:putative FmdB family regulatory protein
MPTYEYACTECSEPFEVVQSIHDPALSECPACGGRLRKVFGNVGVVFKGSGFYRTDSRGKSAAASPAATSTGSTGESSTGSGSGAGASKGAGSAGSSGSSGSSGSGSTASSGATSSGASSTTTTKAPA